MFHTSVPLVEEDEFTVYRMESIPQITREGLVITKTETKYLAVDDHRKHHFAINQEHLSQCISGTNGNKVCEFKQTLLGPEIIIDGVGKLTIRQDCVIQSPTITLLGRAQFNSSGTIRMSGSYVHEWPSHEKIRTTEGQLEATLDQLDQLHAEVQGLKTWTKQAQEEVDNEADWNLVHQYSGVIMSGVAILIAAWAGYTRCARKDTSATHHRRTTRRITQGEEFQLVEQRPGLAMLARDGHHKIFEVYDPEAPQ
ncbi:uncharacterized protein LOC123258301 [Drosophila ananassae]|uniref:uncharacterized protein LOC123258301 n=1 Tax=Drosophila ananassae TaxID=7217 RepID=UPI001CFFF78B|nr:uncharacterized protein LOC123258301 [Drosophila ananassae]